MRWWGTRTAESVASADLARGGDGAGVVYASAGGADVPLLQRQPDAASPPPRTAPGDAWSAVAALVQGRGLRGGWKWVWR